MTYEDLVEDARVAAIKRFFFTGEVIVEKHSVWVVSPSYEAFIDPNIESRTLYLSSKRFAVLNKKLRDREGDKVKISFISPEGNIVRNEAEKTSAIDSKNIENVVLRG